MLRKILACLALLTGLAAVGAPAQAEMAMALASHVEASMSADAARAVAEHARMTADEPSLPDVARPVVSAAAAAENMGSDRLGSDPARE